jgi:hypothetical protein
MKVMVTSNIATDLNIGRMIYKQTAQHHASKVRADRSRRFSSLERTDVGLQHKVIICLAADKHLIVRSDRLLNYLSSPRIPLLTGPSPPLNLGLDSSLNYPA